MNETLQRFAIAACLGLVLLAGGLGIGDPWFWCVLALFIASNYLERRESLETGIAMGIEMLSDMTEEQRKEVIDLVKQAQREDNND